MSRLKIKVCGMRDPANIMELAQLDIDYMGFIFYEKSKRYVAQVPTLTLPPTIQKTGVFVNQTASYITGKIAEGLQAIQLHGEESPALCEALHKPGTTLIKAFGIGDTQDWERLIPYQSCVDYFLFDTKSPGYGGLGKAFDWSALKDYPLDTPYFLSGGLSLENLESALQLADPRLIGLDLNSKFEDQPALKNIAHIKQALKIIKA